MNNLAVCVRADNRNVSPKEAIDAIHNAGFKDVFVQYYHRDDLEFDYEFFKDRYFAVHLHDNDKSDDLHLLPYDGTTDWNNVLSKLKQNNYNGPLTLELGYRNYYLKQSIEDFYKEGYNRGKRLEEIYNKC